MTARTFTRGSSTFTCECCTRRTRLTTQDDTRWCGECYELLGLSNSLSDNGEEDWMASFRDGQLAKIAKLGGDIDKVHAFIPTIFNLSTDTQEETPAVTETLAPAETDGPVKLTPLLQEAINAIADNNGCGADKKDHLKADNMTWFNGADLMEWMDISLQKSGGIMHMLLKGGWVFKAGNDKVRVVKGVKEGGANFVLTDKGIDAATTLK